MRWWWQPQDDDDDMLSLNPFVQDERGSLEICNAILSSNERKYIALAALYEGDRDSAGAEIARYLAGYSASHRRRDRQARGLPQSL